jgi:hypothetical protein
MHVGPHTCVWSKGISPCSCMHATLLSRKDAHVNDSIGDHDQGRRGEPIMAVSRLNPIRLSTHEKGLRECMESAGPMGHVVLGGMSCRRFPERPLAISFRLPSPAAARPCGPIIGICRATPQKRDTFLSFSGALHAQGRRKASCLCDLCGLDGPLPCKARRIAALRTSRITSPVTRVDYYLVLSY